MDAKQRETGNRSSSPLLYLLKWMLAAAVIMTLLLYVPTPYAAYEPGIAFPTKPLVKAEQNSEASKGAFMLTTVQLSYVNLWKTIRSTWDDNIELHRKKDVLGGEDEETFIARQTVIMQGSSVDAIEAAYRAAGVAYQIEPYALVVTDGGDQAGEQGKQLMTGDELLAVRGQAVASLAELRAALDGVTTPQVVEVMVERQERHVQLNLSVSGAVEAGSEAEAVGVAQLAEQRRMIPQLAKDQVTIEAGDIGGPSAGLMFALQTLDLLTAGDLTAGLQVAGTGTIDADGTVGPIGGIDHKVVAADRAGAQVFLVPEKNAEAAREKASAIGTDMLIVSVTSLPEAVEALHSMKHAG
ncbi:PDZ domain-containing protein [Paenibacillus phyllosphaerae]|uniref:endopeptidase La n=1 Tax=Paenibacillus phyllosphaerae TaxID=274593 RepID=A0A7W5FLR4_9BACL|nr:PDZ domain-containing protein [Paenibacillus phyllosphaerae]